MVHDLVRNDDAGKKVLKMFTFEGRMQDERRARISTKATPMAEYQIDETSYKSIKKSLR